VTVEKLSLRRP
jgi:hypothetical protein